MGVDERSEIDGHAPVTVGVVTVVVRLLARHLERGELVGHGELVATGVTADIRGSSDLIRLASGKVSSPADH